MTTEQTPREADARSEIEEFEQITEPIIYRSKHGKVVDPGRVLLFRDQEGKVKTRASAPRMTEAEMAEAASALQGALEAGQAKYPLLANKLIQDPSKLWLFSELQMMLSPKQNEVSYDFTADLMEGLTTTAGQRQEYEFVTAHEETQQLFWNEIGNKYEPEDRSFFIDVLAQLNPEGANRVGSKALAWLDSHGFSGTIQREDEEGESFDVDKRDQLLLNILTWSAQEQEFQKGQEGFFGALDFLQEQVEDRVVSPLINAGVGLLSGPEEAARRRDLTVGQQVAYQFGLQPPEVAGDFGWWQFVSGGVDALTEIGADPIAWAAGVGLGVKAAKTIPTAVKATASGRALAAARSILPKPFTGAARKAPGGRFARITYSLGAKSMDDLLEATVKSGVADDAMNLLKEGNLSKFQRLYPGWRGISDEAIRTIQEAVQTPDEFIEVLKSDALNEVLRSGEKLAGLQANAKRSETALRNADNTLPEIDDTVRAVVDNPGDYVYHATLEGEEIAKTGLKRGTVVSNIEEAINHARSRPKLANNLDNVEIVAIPRSSLVGGTGQEIAKGSKMATLPDNLPPFPGGNPMKPAARVGFGDAEKLFGKRRVNDLLLDQNIPRDIRLQAAKDNLRLNAFNNTGQQAFVLSEIPQKSKRIFSWQKALDTVDGSGRLSTGVRRTVARITPGRIPDEIELFNTREGVDQLRRLGEHFGLRQDVVDDLAGEFAALERGARQEWMWDTFMRRLGRETGVPAFEQQLIQFYKGGGIRSFSASGVDLLDDGSRIPMLASQVTNKLPIPTEVLTQVFRRAKSIGERSKLAKAIGFNGRGLGRTAGRRSQLVKRLRRDLGDEATDLTDDQLYDMAFSLVSPNAGLDGRGLWAGKMAPKVGSAFSQLHQWFTKSMLVFRPIQWMWRVSLLEEPVRAHMFNLPSVYSNPLQYMGKLREAHYVANVRKWAEANMSWGQDIMQTVLRGSRDDVVKRIDDMGLADDIFDGTIPNSVQEIRRGVEQFVENALYGRVRPNKLNPIKRVPWAVKNKAHNIKRAEKAMEKLNLPKQFDFHEAAAPINQRLLSLYLGEAIGSTERKMYQWVPGQTPEEAFVHGRVWGSSLIQFVEDPFGRMALKRRAATLRGQAPEITGHDVVNSSRWPLIAPDQRLKYPGEVDDVAVAERYLDDMLGTEIDHLFKPFVNELPAADLADVLDDFASTRKVTAALGHELIDWDLRSSNYAGGIREVGDYVASVRQDTALEIPSNLVSPSFDPRFLSEDDPGWATRISDWVLQTFGEKATQTLNRRPAWIHEYSRHFENYRALDIPADIAESMAIDNANKMVNHVMFNMNEAPYYVARLNKFIPFFNATYEVLGTWSYKMPVAIGGTWQTGVGEFARKFDRLIDGLVNIGVLDRETNDDGSTSITLNLLPPDHTAAADEELGRMLSGAGFKAVNTLDQAVSTMLNMEEGLGLRSQGYRLAAGHPLNPKDYGVLSFAQADIGLNPATNILVSTLGALIPGAGAPRREAVQEGETLAEVAERLDVDVEELVRYNREIFTDTEDFGSSELYNSILADVTDPSEIVMPRAALNVPQSSLWDAMSDTFMPFGEITSPHEFATNFIPGGMRWALAGLALQNQPTDEFWKDSELTGIFGGLLPEVNQAQAASQLNEAFMYLEAHDIVNGKGPFTRIQEKEVKIQELLDAGDTEAANALRAETNLDIKAFLDRANKVAAESLILRGITGNMLPTTPGHVREEEQLIRDFWSTREYSDSLKIGEGINTLRNFDSMEELDNYKEQLAAWLSDPTGDAARAVFRRNNPQLMAYLTPKTFYKGNVPDINSYEEYQRQIQSGEREPAPLHVTMWRARSAAIQADYYNKFISDFGNEPLEAAATALQNRQTYQALNDERNAAYQGLEMWDEMHGSVYSQWRDENYQDVETWAQDQIVDKLNKVRDNLGILFELEDNLEVELDLNGIANLNGSIRGAIAEISKAINEYNDLTEETNNRNPYEQAINQYFEQVYIPYAEEVSELYDELPEVADSERQSLIYERIKFFKNDYANSLVYLEGDTTTPFPNPLEYSWQGKDEEEQTVKMQQWVTRPVEWMDLDQAQRIVENAPALADFVPSTLADFDIYRRYTLNRLKVDEMFENDEITRTQRTKARDALEEKLKRDLVEMGRGNEVVMMGLTPYEKLELSGLLPENLGIFGDQVRYYKQVLEAADQSAGTIVGRQITAPLYDLVEEAFFADPTMRSTLQDLGINLQDKSALDSFLPWLFFDYTGER